MVAKSAEGAVTATREEPEYRGPREHVKRQGERAEREQPRSEGFRTNAELFHDPSAEILERDNVATPAAKEPTENGSRGEREGEKDEPGVHVAQFQRVHRLGRFDRRKAAPGNQIVREVNGDQRMHANQDARPPFTSLGLANDGESSRAGDREVGIVRGDADVAQAGPGPAFGWCHRSPLEGSF